MRVRIESTVANNPDAHKWLDRILHKISDGWHLWDTTQEIDSSAFEATSWIRNRGTKGDEIFQLLQASLRQDAWGFRLHNRTITVTNDPSGADELKPEDAARLAEMPVVILVENRYSDGLFIRKIIDILDESLSNYWNLPGSPIQIDSVGGIGQMPLAIKEKVSRYPLNLRFVAICDSDKSSPSATESKCATKVRTICEEHNFACWILAKRTSENYLIKILLELWKPNSGQHIQIVESWARLSDNQKNHFNMKMGIPKDRDDNRYPLFQNLSKDDYTTLTTGFGNNVYQCWQNIEIDHTSELKIRSQGDLEYGINLIREQI